MKNILSFLGTITLIGTSTTSLVACNTQQYSEEELTKLKAENKIDTTDENIKNNLEWISQQEKPFNTVDNKYYFVVWRGDNNDDWRIVKFKYDNYEKNKVLDKYNNYQLQLFQTGKAGQGYWKDICLVKNNGMTRYYGWSFHSEYFKSVYRWNNNTSELKLLVDINGNLKVNK